MKEDENHNGCVLLFRIYALSMINILREIGDDSTIKNQHIYLVERREFGGGGCWW